ncbi:MAG: hypothetical protein OZ948_13840 [Deltaproteobacteria bacterium]|nr:hypothetical protein [Deltaproteobacteria bacterium]
MWKYYALLFTAVAAVLAYTYMADPCHRLLRTDFARMRPGQVLVSSEAEKGSPSSVRCRISFREPGGSELREEVWIYQYHETAWEFARVVEAGKQALTGTE